MYDMCLIRGHGNAQGGFAGSRERSYLSKYLCKQDLHQLTGFQNTAGNTLNVNLGPEVQA